MSILSIFSEPASENHASRIVNSKTVSQGTSFSATNKINLMMEVQKIFGLNAPVSQILDVDNDRFEITLDEIEDLPDGHQKITRHKFLLDGRMDQVKYTNGNKTPVTMSVNEFKSFGKRLGLTTTNAAINSTSIGKTVPFDYTYRAAEKAATFDVETMWQRITKDDETVEDLLFNGHKKTELDIEKEKQKAELEKNDPSRIENKQPIGDTEEKKEVVKEKKKTEHEIRMENDPEYAERYNRFLDRKQTDPEFKKFVEQKLDATTIREFANIETQVSHTPPGTEEVVVSKHTIGVGKFSTITATKQTAKTSAFLNVLAEEQGEMIKKDIVDQILDPAKPKTFHQVLNELAEKRIDTYSNLTSEVAKGAPLAGYNIGAFDIPMMVNANNHKAYRADHSKDLSIANAKQFEKDVTGNYVDSLELQEFRNSSLYQPGIRDHSTSDKLKNESERIISDVKSKMNSYIDNKDNLDEIKDMIAFEKAAEDLKGMEEIEISGDEIKFRQNRSEEMQTLDINKYRSGIKDGDIADYKKRFRKKIDNISADDFYSKNIEKRVNYVLSGEPHGTLTEVAWSFASSENIDSSVLDAYRGGTHTSGQDTLVNSLTEKSLQEKALMAVVNPHDPTKVEYKAKTLNPITNIDLVRGVTAAALVDSQGIDARFVKDSILMPKDDYIYNRQDTRIMNSAIGSTAMSIAKFAFSSAGAMLAEGVYHNLKNRPETDEGIVTKTMVQQLYGESGKENTVEKRDIDLGLKGHLFIFPALGFLAASKMSDKQLDNFMGGVADKVERYFDKKGGLSNLARDVYRSVNDGMEKVAKNIGASFKYGNAAVDNKMMGLGFIAAAAIITTADFGRQIGKSEYDAGKQERVNNALVELKVPVDENQNEQYIDPEKVSTNIYSQETYSPLQKTITDVHDYSNSYIDRQNQYDMIGKVNIEQPKEIKPFISPTKYVDKNLTEKFRDIKIESDKANINNNRMV